MCEDPEVDERGLRMGAAGAEYCWPRGCSEEFGGICWDEPSSATFLLSDTGQLLPLPGPPFHICKMQQNPHHWALGGANEVTQVKPLS